LSNLSSQSYFEDEITREELYTQVSEILKESIGNKKYLLQLIAERLSLHIPRSFSYRKIIERIGNISKEKEFCELFQLSDFTEILSTYRNAIILDLLTNDQLRLIGRELCGTKYDPSNRNSLILSISKNATEDKLIEVFTKINLETEEKYVVQQKRRWIVGPLGLMKSSESRGWSDIIELVEILKTCLNTPPQFSEFLGELKEEQKFDWKKNVDDPLYKSKCIQLILAFFDEDAIIKTLNQLIDDAKLNIDSIKKFDSLIVSPHGIFEEGYFGYESLVDLLLNTFADKLDDLDAELRSEGLTNGSIELRVREKCLKKNPREDHRNVLWSRPKSHKAR